MTTRLLPYPEAAHLLGLKKSTLYALVSRKQVPHIRLGPRLVRFDESELKAWVDARRVPAQPEPLTPWRPR